MREVEDHDRGSCHPIPVHECHEVCGALVFFVGKAFVIVQYCAITRLVHGESNYTLY